MAETVAIHPYTSRWRRVLSFILAALIGLSVLLLGFSTIVVAIGTTGKHSTVDRAAANSIAPDWRDVSFSSREDGIQLKGWLFATTKRTGRSLVVVPSWTATRVNGLYSGLAQSLVADGYDVLMFDGRASGESGGDRFTLGNKETGDVLGAYDFMRNNGYDPRQMAFFGLSMGGAAVLLASPKMTDVAAIVTDSAFAELHPILDAQVAKYTHLPSFLDGPLFFTAPLFGLNPDLRPVDTVRSQPNRAFLFFHGANDSLVPPAQAQELRTASINPDSDLMMVAQAEHTGAYPQNPTTYKARLYQFLDHEMATR